MRTTWAKSLLVFLVTLFFINLTSASHARVDNYGNPIPEGSFALTFDSGAMVFHPSDSWSSLPGKGSGQNSIQLSLPVCEKELEADCISEVNFRDGSGKSVSGKFDSYLPITWDGFFAGCDANGCSPTTPPWKFSPGRAVFKADEDRRIPLGSKPSVWTFPGLRHPGGNKYLVRAVTQGTMSNQNDPLDKGSVALWAGGSFNVEISPVIIDEDADWSSIDSWAKTNSIPQGGIWNQFNLWCFGGKDKDDLFCVRRVEDASPRTFEIKTRFDLLRDSFSSHGFMVSRIGNARVSTIRRPNFIEVAFAGTTTSVPSAVGYLPRDETGYREMIKAQNSSYLESGVTNRPQDENDLSGLANWIANASGKHTDGSESGAIASWISLEKSVKFIPTRSSSVWFFRSAGLLSGDFAWLTTCKRDLGVSGVVSSNATVMKPSPPKWNPRDQSLDFKIASPHLDESGKVAEGFYSLSVSREVATCLWGKDAVSARATISVVSQDGKEKIFTSSYTINDGFLSFQIAGFTYSANTIKIRLGNSSGSGSSSAANQATTSAMAKSPTTGKVQTITCVKGKTIKKVTTKTCPSGFRKR